MVKKAILFFTVLFMIFGCEPTVYEGAENRCDVGKRRCVGV